uniref:Uncharacterized protein n=1 Tax=Aureoumbra lagunensis TaxID=44058 RepID=A0A7S3NGQ3_9STRA|mmetsp:Transcript_12039/g.18069  ORF Transcript_12039/g.18069 Transcript_12039/m.18069 type:complete len:180 (-) Transcript_12039:133-672(-)
MERSEDQAYWLHDDYRGDGTQEAVSPMTGDTGLRQPQTNEFGSKPMVIWGFRIVHFGLATMMAATGILSLTEFGRVNRNQLSAFVISFYLILFAVVWFAFETMFIMPIDYFIFHLKRNFGFLFHPLGKAIFIIFVAFLNFGVQEESLGLATGILCLIDGALLVLLFLKYPHYHPLTPSI